MNAGSKKAVPVPKEIRRTVAAFRRRLREEGIAAEKVILCGSFARGDSREYSDIDVAVVSPHFGRDRFEEGLRLRAIAATVDPRIEPVPVSSRAYAKDTWIPLIWAIRTQGVEIRYGC